MTKYILVGGRIHKAIDGGRAFCEELVRDINKNPIKILDCTFALSIDRWSEQAKEDQEFFSKYISNFELELANPPQFTKQVRESDIIFFRGGHVSPLMELLNENLDWIKEIEGKVIAGTSAGADIISKYYFVGKTARIGCGLGLLPIKFIPHFRSDYEGEEKDINWEKALQELKDYEEDLEIVTLKEGEFKIFNN